MTLALSIPALAAVRRAPTPPRIVLHDRDDPRRAAVEAFVRDVYGRSFGARVDSFSPTLVSLRDDAGRIAAAAGFRTAADGPLFLERYLDAPIEQLLGDGTPRAAIVEVGHLAGRPDAGRRIIAGLAAHLMALDCAWVVSTLTRELHRLFLRMGVQPLELARADPQRLGAEAAAWGSYYAHDPIVFAGRLRPSAMRVLARAPA